MAEEYGKIRKSLMVGIADAIRAKKETTDLLSPEQMAAEIRGIESGSSFQSIVTDVITNHIVSNANFEPGGILEDTTPPATLTGAKCYYNGVVLPGFPANAMAGYPYVFIHEQSSRYNLVFSKNPFYFSAASNDKPDRLMADANGEVNYLLNRADLESATNWSYRNNSWYYFGLDGDQSILWSNYDIPDGSATATEIYFEGSEPVPAE